MSSDKRCLKKVLSWELEVGEEGLATGKLPLRLKNVEGTLAYLDKEEEFGRRFLKELEGRELKDLKIMLNIVVEARPKKVRLGDLEVGEVFRTEDKSGNKVDWFVKEKLWTGVVKARMCRKGWVHPFLPDREVEYLEQWQQ